MNRFLEHIRRLCECRCCVCGNDSKLHCYHRMPHYELQLWKQIGHFCSWRIFTSVLAAALLFFPPGVGLLAAASYLYTAEPGPVWRWLSRWWTLPDRTPLCYCQTRYRTPGASPCSPPTWARRTPVRASSDMRFYHLLSPPPFRDDTSLTNHVSAGYGNFGSFKTSGSYGSAH